MTSMSRTRNGRSSLQIDDMVESEPELENPHLAGCAMASHPSLVVTILASQHPQPASCAADYMIPLMCEMEVKDCPGACRAYLCCRIPWLSRARCR